MGLGDFVTNLVAALRYLVAPVVAVFLVLGFDQDHDAFKTLISAAWPWESAPPIWLAIGSVAVLGVTTYFAHRIIVHFLLCRLLDWGFIKLLKLSPKPSLEDLNVTRWRRRHSQPHTPAHSVQLELDQANAAVHFFYCTGWASCLLVWFFYLAFPGSLVLANGFWRVVLVIIGVGFIGDLQATYLDIKAYQNVAWSRICMIQASLNEGDVVLDPFCGCGTTIAAAQTLRWQRFTGQLDANEV